ncbi:MAG: maleylacetoacetate isomerase [Myxococcales bacterium]|nr:MAG: maleylacetoacetate isomerase [Myxococcales bacterium]
MITLYSYWRSSCSWRVRIALHVKGIKHTIVPVHLMNEGGEQYTNEHHNRNPLQQVPVLEVTEQSNTICLAQSLAILEYLEERFTSPALLPQSPAARAKARQIAEMINAGTQPLQNLSVLKHLSEQGIDASNWAHHWINRGLVAVEKEAAKTAGNYCIGDTLSIADLCLVPQLYNARRYDVKVDAYPTLLKIEEHCTTLEAFKNAHPDKQVDAPTD